MILCAQHFLRTPLNHLLMFGLIINENFTEPKKIIRKNHISKINSEFFFIIIILRIIYLITTIPDFAFYPKIKMQNRINLWQKKKMKRYNVCIQIYQ